MADWDRVESRGNVEDRRGNSVGFGAPVGALGTVGVLVFLAVTLFGGQGDGSEVFKALDELSNQQNQTAVPVNDTYKKFASAVLGSTNDSWNTQFSSMRKSYAEPKLVLFRGSTNSGCGGATSDIGPHYCPSDSTIYLDETFFDVLTSQLGAKGGDVAQAYVIAHEVGHHVQNQLGLSDKYRLMQARNPSQENEISVGQELQADCFAGMWAKTVSERKLLEPGEIGEALDAAQAVGDDRIQKKATGTTNPETWTHGSSTQRKEWFVIGYNTKDIESCNTFN
jgi:uncharacterized protein